MCNKYPLLTLHDFYSTELRLQIDECILATAKQVPLCRPSKRAITKGIPCNSLTIFKGPTLLRFCQKVYEEAKTIFYEVNTFQCEAHWLVNRLPEPFNTLGRETSASCAIFTLARAGSRRAIL